MKDEGTFEGGCLCGAVRYRASATPMRGVICHCTMCRRTSGAPVVGWATFRTEDLEWLAGTPRSFRSSDRATRRFCGDCGTALTFVSDAAPESTDVTLASLDVPEAVSPADHTYTTKQIGWMRFADDLPRFRGARE